MKLENFTIIVLVIIIFLITITSNKHVSFAKESGFYWGCVSTNNLPASECSIMSKKYSETH